jgi:hypothetical protein
VTRRALVVYETLWGNTERVARAVAASLATTMTVEVVDSDAAPDVIDGFDLVIVGGPTHAFSMTRPSTRRGAVEQNGAPASPARGIREWLDDLRPAASAIPSAAFDTRVDSPRLPGSAAKAIRHELRSLGFSVEAKPITFRVHGYEGPLIDGELDRAATWASALAGAVPG